MTSSNAFNKVDFPWYPPPTIRVIPFGIPIPFIFPLFGVSNSTSKACGETNFLPSLNGLAEIPLSLGNIDPLATKATNPFLKIFSDKALIFH